VSTTLLYRAWGIRGYHLVRTTYAPRTVCFHVEQNSESFCCAECQAKAVTKAGRIVRRFRAVPIGRTRVWIVLAVQRLFCLKCGVTRQAAITFADPKHSYTRRFGLHVLHLSRSMTLKAVAWEVGVGWDLVKEIQKADLQRRFGKPRLKHLKHIAIDEISIGRGHRYLTLVLDLDARVIVYVGEGKGADSLEVFWRRLRASGACIVSVATDMSSAYITALAANLSKAIHVFDHFHVIKLFNDKLSLLRQAMQREAETMLQKKVLKGTRWLLLKNPENLDATRNERKRLEEALALNKPLATAYYLKEDLRQLWDQRDKPQAERFLKDWIARAQSSGIRMLQQFAVTLATHRSGILAYYDCRISSAPLEGTNTKIRVLQRQAYGYRDHEFFKLKLYALHESTYALTG
jgi:transposase